MKRLRSACVLALVAAMPARAQLAPNANWHTIRTAHFYVHFTPPLEAAARRAAADAEKAYTQLSADLVPPRGPIDLVIADNIDATNGYATPFPTNRIVIYANPPVNDPALRFTDDPDAMVVTHELTHIFHLDRSRGIWDLGQHIFGRAPYLFPNAYAPGWLTEGLAVYYESKLTGAGRVLGSDHRMIARAFGAEDRFPSIDRISRADAFFPYGNSPYVFGSLFMDYLARTRGDHMRALVESEANQWIPLWLDRPARQAFGISFTAAWRKWSDSVTNTAGDPSLPVPGWRYLTVGGGTASYPRWADDTAITFTGTTGRSALEARSVTLDGSVSGLERRNSESPTLLGTSDHRLFTQLEYVDAYHIRSDLFVQRGRHTVRLTTGARLTVPDRRGDGRIVAVQTLPAATRLVTLWSDGSDMTPLTSGSEDEQWAEPRWSPDGAYVAAALWHRGGTSEIVVVDTTGRIVQHISPAHAIQSAPSWSPNGNTIYFTSDRSGVTQVYAAPFRPHGAAALQVLTAATTGIFFPEVSPDGHWLAASVVLGDGYHLGIAAMDRLTPVPADTLSDAAKPQPPGPADSVTSAATSYSPWRTLWPRYWMPVEEASLNGGARLGLYTSGSDVVGRHAYEAQVMVPTDATGVTGYADYSYAGLGTPVLVAAVDQNWENLANIRDDQRRVVGVLRKRTRTATAGASWIRPRFRTYSSFTLQGGVEVNDYSADPAPLIARIDSSYARTYYYPELIAGGVWSNAQGTTNGISPEDGLTGSFSARERFVSGSAARRSFSVVGAATGYKSLDLPGFAHHVIALTGAAGYRDDQSTGYFEVGGASGSALQLAPGVVLGEGRRTFPVRGFNAASLIGIRAYAASAEYRVPLEMMDAGWGLLPLFLGRSSVSLFYDVGGAWCPTVLPGGAVCRDPALTHRYTISSAGAELNVTAAVLQWDTPYRFRFGVALPSQGRDLFGVSSVSTYFTLGLSF
jgi:hypothetical protein